MTAQAFANLALAIAMTICVVIAFLYVSRSNRQ